MIGMYPSQYFTLTLPGSFAGLGFLSLYLSGKIKAFDRQGHVAKLCIVILPLLLASLVGISRVDDYRHHWEDVFVGGLIGLYLTSFSFTLYYPKCMKSFDAISNLSELIYYLQDLLWQCCVTCISFLLHIMIKVVNLSH
jgi:putative effector of murein hydrolase LrgA (UPF0299 family)